jgi:Uma2 family endonuclease
MTEVADPIPAAPLTKAENLPEAPAPVPDPIFPLVLHVPEGLRIDHELFLALCQENETLRIERNAEGDLVIMPPAGGETSNRNLRLAGKFDAWVEQDGTGEGFDSSGGFRLPNGAERSPDLAWVLRERLDTLTPEQTEKFIPLCPDFVLELRSPSDGLRALQEKMREYIENGARLGWLVDPQNRHVYIYRPDSPVQRLDDPATVCGDPVLPGFVIDAQSIFNRRLGRRA